MVTVLAPCVSSVVDAVRAHLPKVNSTCRIPGLIEHLISIDYREDQQPKSHPKVQVVPVKSVSIRDLFDISEIRDAITISEVHHLWINHCDLYACTDGLLDITNASDLVTVSWVKTSDHHKVMLIQNGQERAAEVDKLNVTLHHNYHMFSSIREV